MTVPVKAIRRIRQRDWEHGDCGLACVAMVTGRPYEEVVAQFRNLPGKSTTKNLCTGHSHLIQMLHALKFHADKVRFKSWAHMKELKNHAIVKVNLKSSGEWHWVVYDAGRRYRAVHDPAPGKRKVIKDFRGRGLRGNGNFLEVRSAQAASA